MSIRIDLLGTFVSISPKIIIFLIQVFLVYLEEKYMKSGAKGLPPTLPPNQ